LQVEKLLNNPGIIRNRRKIKSAIENAAAFIKIQDEFKSFDQYIWGFVGGKPIQNQFHRLSEIPSETDLSRQISKELKERGMSFVGPTIMYAFMQAVGMVNDHLIDCFRFNEIRQMG
jgi:DNA-3-methyladenine glycosylase I